MVYSASMPTNIEPTWAMGSGHQNLNCQANIAHSYVRDDFRWTKMDLALDDIPGERLADMVVAAHRRLAGWSDTVLRMLRVCPEFHDSATDYLNAIENAERSPGSLDEEGLLHEYRRTLARLIEGCMPIVTPSSFLIDAAGNSVPEHILASDAGSRMNLLATERFSGLSKSQQFAPLSAKLRGECSPMTGRFSSAYQSYRRFIMPFAKRLKACDTLLILIDVAMLLEGGPGMLNANRKLIEQIFHYVDPGFTLLHEVGHRVTQLPTLGWLGLRGVRRIGVVATKADRVHQDDRTKLRVLSATDRGSVDQRTPSNSQLESRLSRMLGCQLHA